MQGLPAHAEFTRRGRLVALVVGGEAIEDLVEGKPIVGASDWLATSDWLWSIIRQA